MPPHQASRSTWRCLHRTRLFTLREIFILGIGSYDREADESEICRADQQAGEAVRRGYGMEPSRSEAEPLPSQRTSCFSLEVSTDWMKPIHIKKDKLFYVKSSDLNVNHV